MSHDSLRANLFPDSNKTSFKMNSSVQSLSGSIGFCRICHDQSLQSPLIEPCHCSGSISWVHLNCLEHWLSRCRKEYCELCNFHFECKTVYPSIFQVNDFPFFCGFFCDCRRPFWITFLSAFFLFDPISVHLDISPHVDHRISPLLHLHSHGIADCLFDVEGCHLANSGRKLARKWHTDDAFHLSCLRLSDVAILKLSFHLPTLPHLARNEPKN